MLVSDVCLTSVCLSAADIGRNSRTERPRKTKIGTEVAHVTRDLDTTFKVKYQRSRSPGRFCWLYWQTDVDGQYSNGDLSVCVHDVYRVTTCRPGRGHISGGARN